MLESSRKIRDLAVNRHPALAGRIAVAGSIPADALLALRPERDALRRRLGIGAEETAVLFQSAWGPRSLLETLGPALIEQAKELMDRGPYRFLLMAHPHFWSGWSGEEHPLARYLRRQRSRGFLVVEPDEDIPPYLAAADLAVTDHTSICLLFALLGRPLLFVPIPEDALLPDSPRRRLYGISPQLGASERLEAAIPRTLREYPLKELEKLAPAICSYPGEAAERTRRAIYSLLGKGPFPGELALGKRSSLPAKVC